MRDYGKVYTAFWSNEEMRGMSEDARTLALYLMTCPHGNMLGCFRLPNAYAADDLQWDQQRVSKGFAELLRNGFAYRCDRTFWVFIRKHLEWNQFENPNVGIAAGKLFDSLPIPAQIKALLVNALRLFSPKFPEVKLIEFESLSIPFENPFETLSKTVVVAVAVTEPEPEQDQEQTHAGADAPDSFAVDALVPKIERRKSPRAGIEVQEVFDYWKQAMRHPQARLDDKRAKAIGQRLADGYTVGQLCQAVDGCRKSPYHMGQNDSNTVYDDIELICRNTSKVESFINRGSATPNGINPGLQSQIDSLQEWMEQE